MSIRLLTAVLISGVHYPANGSTLWLAPGLEADLVQQNKAAWVAPPGIQTDIVEHAAAHAAMGIFDSVDPGACVIRSERNISHTTKTTILLPSAPTQLAILWAESGTSGSLKFVLEAASSLDADARLANDSAHGEIASGDSVLVRFVPSTLPTYLYLLATSAVGGGSNVATIIAKVTE